MKTMMQLVAVAVFVAAPFFLTAQQPSPCLCNFMSAEAQKRCNNKDLQGGSLLPSGVLDPITAQDNHIRLGIKDESRTLDNYEYARYKAFWIWGDGNYRHFTANSMRDDLDSYVQEYNYSAAGTYNPVVVLVEKKSNKQPPGRTERKVSVNTVNRNTFPPAPFQRRLDNPFKTADIFSTEKLRAGGFHTAVVVSAPANDLNTGIFFFYNGINDERNNTLVTAHVHDIDTLLVPAYGMRADLQIRQGAMADMRFDPYVFNMLPNSLYTSLLYSFQNYIFLPMDVSAIRAMPPTFDEYRLFPVLETIWADTLAEAGFMTLVVGKEPPSGDFYTETRIDSMIGVFRNLLRLDLQDFKIKESFRLSRQSTENEGTDFRMGFEVKNGDTSQLYLRGADLQKVKLVGSIDPNELEVLKICPQGNGKYKVNMRLDICNEGYMFENSIRVRLTDAGNHFSKFEILDSLTRTEIEGFSDSLDATHRWSFTWAKHLSGIYDTLENGLTEYAPRCADFEFTVETDWAGVLQLQKGQGLEMCVLFSLATVQKEDCGFNFSFEDEKVTLANGYKCGDPCSCNWLCWLLIIVGIIVLLLLIWWWYKKKQDNNP